MPALARDPHLCLLCGSDCVYPVEWQPIPDRRCWVQLRCGECDTWRAATFDDDTLDEFDRKLSEDERRMGAEADRLHRDWRAAEADAFSVALARGLIDAGDFAY